jgi:hypothetical protein
MWLEVPEVGIPARTALLSRRHSGFCGLNRLDESTKADHYSRKLCQAELLRDRLRRFDAWDIIPSNSFGKFGGAADSLRGFLYIVHRIEDAERCLSEGSEESLPFRPFPNL